MREQVTNIYNKVNDIFVLQDKASSLQELISLQNSLNDIKQEYEILISEVNNVEDIEDKKSYLVDIDILDKVIKDTQDLIDIKFNELDPNYKYKKYLIYTVCGITLYKLLRRK